MDNDSTTYRKLFSRRVDLVGDYAGSEPFLLEGDSLLLHHFSDSKLDLEDGFQILHAVWLVESFLHGLLRRRCNFDIVFFDDHAELCAPSHVKEPQRARYRLVRAVVLRHLQANLCSSSSSIRILVFPSRDCGSFLDALTGNSYMFIMMNDGAATTCVCPEHTRDKIALRASVCAFVNRGYNVALINELEWRDTKVITAVIEGSAKTQASTPRSSDNAQVPAVCDDRPLYEALVEHHTNAQQKLSERLYLAAATAGLLLSADARDGRHVAIFLAHAAFQGQLRLATRYQPVSYATDNSGHFLDRFAHAALKVISSASWKRFLEEAQVVSDIADLLDGRLFGALLSAEGVEFIEPMNKETQCVLESLSTLASSIARTPLDPSRHLHFGYQHKNQESHQSSHPSLRLLPFTGPAFSKHLQPVKLDIDNAADGHLTEANSRVFRELTHWHNAKRSLNRKITVAKRQQSDFYALRRNQRFMAEMMAYAASLTNAVGTSLEAETIIQQNAKAVPTKYNAHSNRQDGRVGKASGGKLSKAQAIRNDVAAKRDLKDASTASRTVASWHSVCANFDDEPDASIRLSKTLQYLNTLPDSKKDVIGAEVQLYALSCLLLLWKASISADRDHPDYGIAARIWDTVSCLKNTGGMTKTIVANVRATIETLGLPFSVDDSVDMDRDLPFHFALRSPKPPGLAIALPSTQFQLLHCGPFFNRKIDSAPDDRVPFVPDGWQRRVLDVIDSGKSLFVVAPTSAGKTFISFYAMKKVLESSESGVLVYVAPTKALVNQIAAEIQARFSKSYKHAGRSVWGIHTRDYRINSATGCQILVTVPHILQIMLLSPTNAESWSSRIERIVFDEVHCIGQLEDGIVWEQLLLLAPCPIIALSATVGNPEEFSSWLESAQEANGTELVTIHHPHRYSDLRKFVYTPPKMFTFAGLPEPAPLPQIGLDDIADFEFVHPVASLLNRSRGIPDDFSLEARDCFTLWKTMKAHETESHKVEDTLDPDTALPSVIEQSHIIAWGQALKRLLKKWMEDHSSPFDSTINDLGKELYRLESVNDSVTPRCSASRQLASTTLPLLYQLHKHAVLPAILFNYDRSECERICRTVVEQLEMAEHAWKDSSPAWKRKLSAWEEWKKLSKRTSKKSVPTMNRNAREDGMNKADLERETASSEPNAWASFDPNAAIDGFHFTDRTKLLSSELDAYVKELRDRGVAQWLLDALHRGLAVHHAGMNRKYRYVIELLFRKGYLRVIVATGTLALGINMPCKTVVFCGDSVFLTALNFRQAAGRAGRRGFDVLGNVVFHGIPVSKICRLLSSRLPDLIGHFPITTTLVLRLCSLVSESKQSAFAARAVDALFSQPRIYLGGAESRMTVLHHLRFSIEYLRRQFLLDQAGSPLNFAGCVSHLYYTESSNFAFHALLKEGYFHQLCAGIRQHPEKSERILRTLMVVLSHVFCRRYCRQVDMEFVEQVVKRSPSVVFLPSLPEDAATVLREHNRQTLEIFKTYVRTFVEQHIRDEDCSLPLSGLKFGGDGAAAAQATVPMIRSSFVALSGHGDEFESISELCQTVRAGVFLEEAVIPHVAVHTNIPLNAYLYDFFKHGDVSALVQANGIRRGDIWFILNDFASILKTIVTSITNFVQQDAGEEGSSMLDAQGESDEETPNPPMLAPPPFQKKPTRPQEAVPDSWDDAGDVTQDSLPPSSRASGALPSDGESGGTELMSPVWEEGEGKSSLLDVLDGFKLLEEEFNQKFKAMWT